MGEEREGEEDGEERRESEVEGEVRRREEGHKVRREKEMDEGISKRVVQTPGHGWVDVLECVSSE